MEELKKRFSSGLWIILAGTIAEIINLTIQNISAFNLTPVEQTILVIVLTATVSQITKYLNK